MTINTISVVKSKNSKFFYWLKLHTCRSVSRLRTLDKALTSAKSVDVFFFFFFFLFLQEAKRF